MKKIGKVIIGIVGIVTLYRAFRTKYDALVKRDTAMSYNKILSQWCIKAIDNTVLERYFKRRKIQTIAIYGIGTLGEVFYKTIKNSEQIEVKYFIDKASGNSQAKIDDIPVCNLEMLSDMPEVDAVIITPVYYLQEIEEELLEKEIKATKIISMEHIVDGR